MKISTRSLFHPLIAALLIISAAIIVFGQNPAPVKQNRRADQAPPAEAKKDLTPADAQAAQYSYEFSQPNFYVNHIIVKHDALGHGQVTFSVKDTGDPVTEPLALSDAARARIIALWESLRFLDSDTNYQSEKQFPHLGTMWLEMKKGGRERKAEFNWTNDKDAAALVGEYQHVANQTMFVFNITLSRQNQPLEAPKLLEQLDRMVARNEVSDKAQLVPLLEDLSNDERIPLIARNHATRILKKIQKN